MLKKLRRIAICKNLKCESLDKLIGFYEVRLSNIRNLSQIDKDLILYFFNRSLNSFVMGNFEDCFVNCFKIVFEINGFLKIHKINGWEERRPQFVKIRAAIVHTKKEEIFETPDELEEFRKNLFSNALEIIKITKFEFMDVIAK